MRPSRTETFLTLAGVFSMRGTCPRAQVGAVIVNGNHVISHGYNGAPARMPHCNLIGCNKAAGQGCTNAVHAEENAITYAAKVGVGCQDADLYCTHEPCLRCARLIVQAGIVTVHYMIGYREHDGTNLLSRAGVMVFKHPIAAVSG